MLKFILTVMLFLISSQAWAITWYIRADGSTGTNCTGQADAAYDGSGTGEACALNSLHWILPSRNESTSKSATAGDTIVLQTGQQFRVGCFDAGDCRDASVNLTSSAFCDSSYSYECYLGTIPSNVTMIGCTTSGCGCTTSKTNGISSTSCSSTRPQIWGAGRISQVLSAASSTAVTIKDLEITDHADCGTGHSSYGCGSADSSELSARDGIVVTGATNVTLTNVKVHGLFRDGLYGGSVAGMTISGSDFSYNASAGYDGDSCGGDTCGNSGTIAWSNTRIQYNGCVEDNDGFGTIMAEGCYSQDQSGYGDGLGMNNTGGIWTFNDVDISHNVSDGLDLLYLNRGSYSGGTLTIKRSNFEGNAGNAVKGRNALTIEDSVLIGNCGYFQGQSLTCTSGTCGAAFNNCRAGGNTIEIDFANGDSSNPKIYSSTILSNGDVGIDTGGTCTSGTDVLVKNSILRGGWQYGYADTASIYYAGSGTCLSDFVEDYNICYGWKEGSSACNGTNSTDTVDPLFTGTILQGTDATTGYYTSADYVSQLLLQSGSTARGLSDETISGDDDYDFNTFDRGASWDAGAFEYGTSYGGSPPSDPIYGVMNIGGCSANGVTFR